MGGIICLEWSFLVSLGADIRKGARVVHAPFLLCGCDYSVTFTLMPALCALNSGAYMLCTELMPLE